MLRPYPLPAVIEEIVRAIGHGATMALVRAFGGQELRIPRGPGNAVWEALAEAIGEPETRRLAEAFGGGEAIYVALCDRALRAERNRRMVERYEELLAADHSGRFAVAVLVREFRPISYRTVETIVNSPLFAPDDGRRQAALF